MTRLTEEGRHSGGCAYPSATGQRPPRLFVHRCMFACLAEPCLSSERIHRALDWRHGEYQLEDALADIATRKDRIEFQLAFCRERRKRISANNVSVTVETRSWERGKWLTRSMAYPSTTWSKRGVLRELEKRRS